LEELGRAGFRGEIEKESKHIFMYLLLTLLNPSDHALFSFSDS
jgi:hypothetical protein